MSEPVNRRKSAGFLIDDIHDGPRNYSELWHVVDEVEVVGNVYDNPEYSNMKTIMEDKTDEEEKG